MPAYILALIEVRDRARYAAYARAVPAVLARYGGRFLVRGGNPEPLEGELPAPRVVILEFPDRERALAFYRSPEYRAILPQRRAASEGRLLLLEGSAG